MLETNYITVISNRKKVILDMNNVLYIIAINKKNTNSSCRK